MATIITNHNRTDDMKPSEHMLPHQLKIVGILEIVPCVRNAPCITYDLALSSVILATRKGHYANQCQKTTNNNAQGRAYMLRDRNAYQNPNVVTGSENRPPMLNKDNYVPWSSCLLHYAKSRPNGKLIYNSILNGPYVRHDELTEKELKQVEADDQAIQTILLGLPEDIYAAVDSCETAQEIWLRVQQMMKGSDIGIQEKKAKLFNEWERFTSTDGESIESYYHRFSKLMNDFKRNKHFPEKIASNLKFLNNLQLEWSRHVTIVHQTKDLHTSDYTQLYDFLKYNQKEVDDLRAERLAKSHDPLALVANSNNPFSYLNYMQQPMSNPEDIIDPTTAMNMALVLMDKEFKLNYSTPINNNQRISSSLAIGRLLSRVVLNAVQNQGVQNVGNHNGLIVVLGIANQNPNGNGNVVAARAEGNAIGNNGNQIRCYNCRGLGHLARNCTVRPRRRDVAYLQTQLLIAQKEEVGIQLQAEEFDLMAAAADLDEIEEVNANCILMANLQQASTSGTQTDKAPVYDSDGSAEVHNYDNCYDNEIFNMFTQEEQYTELLEPIPEPHQVQQNDSNVISDVSSVEQDGGTVDQHPATIEETRAYFESLYNNLAIKVEKVNSINRKMKETNADLTTELARYKNQEKCFEISQEKYDKLERCYQKFVYQKSDFKIREDELLDKQIQLENKIKELDNILVKTAQQKQQSLYNGKVLLEKHDPPVVYDSEETLQLAQESRLKMKQLNKEIKPENYTNINHLSGVFVSQTAKSREGLYLLNTSKTANVSKSFSTNEEFSDDTTPSVARKFCNKHHCYSSTCCQTKKMTLDIHNWSCFAHQEIHKIVKDEIFPIVNQVDARVQNFEIQFLKEAAKFVRDFKSLAKEADESLAKHKALELEIERLLRAVVSQDIMSVVQSNYVIDTSNLQTELDRTKERLENCIIKKENEYAKLWNDWYKKCEECKYDKISYDKAYNDM
ncbi:copia protein [Tanacetum coccineum]